MDMKDSEDFLKYTKWKIKKYVLDTFLNELKQSKKKIKELLPRLGKPNPTYPMCPL